MTPLTPLQMVTGEIPGVLSLWHNNREANGAYEMLGLFGALYRLSTEWDDVDANRLEQTIHDEYDVVMRAASHVCLDADSWLHAAGLLPVDGDEEADWKAHQLFRQVDQAGLVLWAGIMFNACSTWTARMHDALQHCRWFISAHADVFFLVMADDAEALLAAARPDLQSTEPLLWDTLTSYRTVLDRRNSLDRSPSKEEVLRSVPRMRRHEHN